MVTTRFLILAAVLSLLSVRAETQPAPNPSTFKLTTTPPIALEYVGAFRLPRDTYPASANPDVAPEYRTRESLEFGGTLIGYDAATQSLLIGSRRNRVALVSIPTPSKATTIADLPFAALRSPAFVDPSGNTWTGIQDGVGYAALGGGMVLGDKLYYSGVNFYDANSGTRRAFRVATFPLTDPPALLTPWRTVGVATEQGHIGGYFIPIPERHQAALGGTLLTGLQAVSIQVRTSAGPVGHAWNPADLLKGNAPAKMLVGYPLGHWTLGPWDGVNPFYGISTQIYGGTFVGDWLMFWGMHGLTACYGNGTPNKAEHGTKGPDGEMRCFDPTNAAKGNHGYPYQFQQYAYKVSELAEVKAGKREPWSLTPVVWTYQQPFLSDLAAKKLGGVVEDDKGHIYVSQMFTDTDGYSSRALILVYRAKEVGATEPPPTPPLPPVPPVPPSDVEALRAQIAALTVAVDNVQKQVAALTKERDSAVAQLAPVQAERDAALKARDAAVLAKETETKRLTAILDALRKLIQ